MNLHANDEILLGTTRYRIEKSLWQSAFSAVYLATLFEKPDAFVVLKFGSRQGSDSDRATERENLEKEAAVLRRLNEDEGLPWNKYSTVLQRWQAAQSSAPHRQIVTCLDAGEIEAEAFLVLEHAPPEFEPPEVQTLEIEHQVWAVGRALAQVMQRAHGHDYSLSDFDPATKGDRIRVRWVQPPDQFEFKVIDWNGTGNREGIPADLLLYGRHLYFFLLGQHLTLENNRPPINLRLSSANWEKLTEGSRQLLSKLLHRDPTKRYVSARELLSDIDFFLDCLKDAEAPSGPRLLQDRMMLMQAKPRFDRVLIAGDLALRQAAMSDQRSGLQEAMDRARGELEKEDWVPVSQALSTMRLGDYSQAIRELADVLRVSDKESRRAHFARLYRLLAQVGDVMKKANNGAVITALPAWQACEQAVQAMTLSEPNWRHAEQLLGGAMRAEPRVANWEAVKKLQALAEAGLKAEAAAGIIETDEPLPGLELEAWCLREAAALERLEGRVRLLLEARDKAPDEPEFQGRAEAERMMLSERRERLDAYTEAVRKQKAAQSSLSSGLQAQEDGRWQAAENAYKSAAAGFTASADCLAPWRKRGQPAVVIHAVTLSDAAAQAELAQRAAQDKWQARAAFDKACKEVQTALDRHDYAGAVIAAADAQKQALTPEQKETARCLFLASERAEELRQTDARMLEDGIRMLERWSYSEAQTVADGILHRHHNTLSELGMADKLPAVVGRTVYQVPAEIRDRAAQLKQTAAFVLSRLAQVAVDQAAHCHMAVRDGLREIADRLQALNGSLADDESAWLADAEHWLTTEETAQEALNAPKPDITQLRTAAATLRDTPGPAAVRLRASLRSRWLSALRSDSTRDLDSVQAELETIYDCLPETSAESDAGGGPLWLVKLARQAQRQLTMESDAALPPVFQAPGEDPLIIRQQLAQLDRDLRTLEQSDWPVLRAQALDRRRTLQEDHLAAFFASWLELARASANERTDVAAQARLKDLRCALPEILWQHLTAEAQADYETLAAKLARRIETNDKLDWVLHRVETGETFSVLYGELKGQMAAVQVPDDIPPKWVDLMVEWDMAARLEQCADKECPPGAWLARGLEAYTLQDKPLPALEKELTADRLKYPRDEARKAISEWAKKQGVALQEEAGRFADGDAPDGAALSRRWWEAAWLSQLSQLSRPVSPEATPQADLVPRAAQKLLQRVLTRLAEAQDTETAADAVTLLEQIVALNDGLVQAPELQALIGDSAVNTVSLKPPVAAPPYKAEDLAAWQLHVLSLVKAAKMSIDPPLDLAALCADALTSQAALAALAALWPADAGTHPFGSPVTEAEAHVSFSGGLAGIQPDGSTQAWAKLTELDTMAALPPVEGCKGLLGPQHRALNSARTAIERQLEVAVPKQLDAILSDGLHCEDRLVAEFFSFKCLPQRENWLSEQIRAVLDRRSENPTASRQVDSRHIANAIARDEGAANSKHSPAAAGPKWLHTVRKWQNSFWNLLKRLAKREPRTPGKASDRGKE